MYSYAITAISAWKISGWNTLHHHGPARHFKAAAQPWLEEPQGWPWPKLGDVQKMLGLPKSRIVAGLRCVF